MRLLLVTPPFTQLNTPYPATAYLTRFLRRRGFAEVNQIDLSIECMDVLFSGDFFRKVASLFQAKAPSGKKKARPEAKLSPAGDWFSENAEAICSSIDSVRRFLQGKDPSLALRIATPGALWPAGPRALAALDPAAGGGEDALAWAFGAMGVQDRAKYLATLFLDDLGDVVRQSVDPHFEFSKYGEKLAASAASFDPLEQALKEQNLLTSALDSLVDAVMVRTSPQVVGITVPFPGNLLGALRVAKRVRQVNPSIKIVLGGGYVNTELRELSEPRLFGYVDYVSLDDGEEPLERILKRCLFDEKKSDGSVRPSLLRTFELRNGEVYFSGDKGVIGSGIEPQIQVQDLGAPTYDGLALDKYVSLIEMLNPMHRLWSDSRWNKLTLAHGCYWKKCNFCDTSLDYINRYVATPAIEMVDRMETLIAETGESGFHFVDEAAPPALLRAVSEEILKRKLKVTWWGNLRFEKTFTPELARLMALAGCVAVTGGLEVASDRLLKLMNKGVTVQQVARVTRALSDAGILVHAYLMYGFPTQTAQETVDSLEIVRQLFEAGCIQSGYWHRFSATVHSAIGMNPKRFGIELLQNRPKNRLKQAKKPFAVNDLAFVDPTGCDHAAMGQGLRTALYNFMNGQSLDRPVHQWFAGKTMSELRIPRASVDAGFIEAVLGLSQ